VACREICIPSFIGFGADIPERIKYKLGMLMYQCQHNKAPRYLMDHCTSVSDVVLPIVNGYVLPVVMKSPLHVTGSVPLDVRHLPLLARLSGTLCPRTCRIRRFLRTVTVSEDVFICAALVCSALRGIMRMCYINPHLTFG